MNIEKELQQRIIKYFSIDRFAYSGYSYDLLPPEPDHFWIRVKELTNPDINFLHELLEEYKDPINGPVLSIKVSYQGGNMIKFSFY